MKYVTLALAFIAGAIAAMASQAITGWWLDSGRGVAVMLGMLAALSIVLVWLDRHAPIALWAGMMIATVLILFRIGPGTIIPIVIAFAAVWSAIARRSRLAVAKLATVAHVVI